MKHSVNCWEYIKCGREPGGANISTQGICPAAADLTYNGINSGTNGGRFCWNVAGTMCRGKVQGTIAAIITDCIECDFLKKVLQDEGQDFSFFIK